ncbi:Ejaculatory bulb-specific protein 3 [Harpegnathos saltator]|uniref:Ejaculatory bulb-specific protein 3 n=1 Tax=Harpegnathos saltator TaxID=610380 RepID=E2CAG2_HARSA|nr:Ejaculatory bulb-specific protein 3 [Harpegnathos saltator]
MKFALVCLLALVAVVYVSAKPQGYTTKYDNIDVEQILHNDRLLQRYVDCMLDKVGVRCPPEAIELKKVLSDALDTECNKCNDRQKEVAKKAIRFLIDNKPDIWKELKAKYDPEGKYVKKYEKLAEEEKIKF